MTGLPTQAATPPKIPDWGGPPLRGGIADLVALEAGVALLAGAVVGLLADPVIGAGVGLLMLVASQVRVAGGGRRVLRALRARPLEARDGMRFPNVTSGLCSDRGIEEPVLWVIDDGGINALVAWSGGGHIAVGSGLLAQATRTEVEAAVAFCLARLVSGDARRASYLTAAGLPGRAKVGRPHDLATVAITRYPPGLASVLRKASPRRDRTTRLWMVGDEASHEPLEERLSELADL